MRFRLWPFVGVVFAVLLSLVAVFAWSLSRESTQIDGRAAEAHRRYQRADDSLTNIRADVYRAALLSGEPSSALRGSAIQQQLEEIRMSSDSDMQRLAKLLGASQQAEIDALRSELGRYWDALDIKVPGKNTATQTSAPANRSEQREIVLTLAEQMDALNETSIRQQEAEIRQDRQGLRRFALRATVLLLGLGLTIAIASIAYLARLEGKSDTEMRRAEEAEYELRLLSQQLVRAQEEERKTISRELHDEVGQILTGLRLELGALAGSEGSPDFGSRLSSVKTLAEEALRAVRNLSLLLRPSMLDDLGLGPALRWQAKEFSQRMTIPISVDIEGDLEGLPEAHRLCLYRVVQEALTNSAKHAEATRIAITISKKQDIVKAVIQDNGKGFLEREQRTQGLGLAGMEERIRTLQGTLAVSSRPGEGTELQIALPLYAGPSALSPV